MIWDLELKINLEILLWLKDWKEKGKERSAGDQFIRGRPVPDSG